MMEILKKNKSLKSTIKFPCSYIEGNMEQRIYVDLKEFDNKIEAISELSKNGFRRSYDHMYIPNCDDCKKCISSRINIDRFFYSKSIKRNLKINQDLKVVVNSKNIEKQRYNLFQKYCEVRHSHGQMQFMTYDEFNNFFHHNCNSNKIVDLFNPNNQLVGSMLLDDLNDGFSAVYSFFNPKLKKRGLGKNLILRSINLLEKKNKKFLYLGYWIRESRSMNYKSSFSGLELFLNGNWKIFS